MASVGRVNGTFCFTGASYRAQFLKGRLVLNPGFFFFLQKHYETAPADPRRPQNRGSHDYLRAHKGSRRMSRPLIQETQVLAF